MDADAATVTKVSACRHQDCAPSFDRDGRRAGHARREQDLERQRLLRMRHFAYAELTSPAATSGAGHGAHTCDRAATGGSISGEEMTS